MQKPSPSEADTTRSKTNNLKMKESTTVKCKDVCIDKCSSFGSMGCDEVRERTVQRSC